MKQIASKIFACLALALSPTFAWAIGGTGPASDRIGGTFAPGYVPPALEDVDIDEKLGQQVPLDLTFTDENGRTVPLRDLMAGQPTVLQLGYFECPMLCGLVAEGWVKSIQQLPMDLGRDYQVISISIDHNEDWKLAQLKKRSFLQSLDKPINAAGVHYLVGSEANIKAITEATGFGFKWVPAAGQFSHPAAIIVLSPQGKIAQYLYGIEYPPADLQAAIETAAQEQSRPSITQFVMTCFHMIGGGQVNALAIMRGAGAVTVLVMIGVLFTLVRRTNRRLATGPSGQFPVEQPTSSDSQS